MRPGVGAHSWRAMVRGSEAPASGQAVELEVPRGQLLEANDEDCETLCLVPPGQSRGCRDNLSPLGYSQDSHMMPTGRVHALDVEERSIFKRDKLAKTGHERLQEFRGSLNHPGVIAEEFSD